MKTAGMLLWIVGAALFAFGALAFDPSVETYGLGERVANLALLQQQELIAMAGAALFLAGIIFHAAGEIVEAMQVKPAPLTAPAAIIATGAASGSDETDAELMDRFGITREGDKFAFGQYKYDRLADAVAYAKKAT